MAKIQDVLFGNNVRKMKSDPIVDVSGGEFNKNLIAGAIYQIGNGGMVDGIQYDQGDLIINFGNKISKFGSGGGGKEYYPLIDMDVFEFKEEWHRHTLRVPIIPDMMHETINVDDFNHLPIGYTIAFLFEYQDQLRFHSESNQDWGRIQGPEGPANTYMNTGLGTSLAIEKVDTNVWSLSGRATIIELPNV